MKVKNDAKTWLITPATNGILLRPYDFVNDGRATLVTDMHVFTELDELYRFLDEEYTEAL